MKNVFATGTDRTPETNNVLHPTSIYLGEYARGTVFNDVTIF